MNLLLCKRKSFHTFLSCKPRTWQYGRQQYVAVGGSAVGRTAASVDVVVRATVADFSAQVGKTMTVNRDASTQTDQPERLLGRKDCTSQTDRKKESSDVGVQTNGAKNSEVGNVGTSVCTPKEPIVRRGCDQQVTFTTVKPINAVAQIITECAKKPKVSKINNFNNLEKKKIVWDLSFRLRWLKDERRSL